MLSLLLLLLPWTLQPAPVPWEEPVPAPLLRVVPQAPNVRGWRPLLFPEHEAKYEVDAYGYPRPRIVITPGGDGYYPLTGEPYGFLPTRRMW